MATQLLATDDTAAQSGDVNVLSGAVAAVFLKAAGTLPAEAQVHIEAKDSEGNYNRIGTMGFTQPGFVVYGPLTFRVNRVAGYDIGVEQG